MVVLRRRSELRHTLAGVNNFSLKGCWSTIWRELKEGRPRYLHGRKEERDNFRDKKRPARYCAVGARGAGGLSKPKNCESEFEGGGKKKGG